MLLNPFLLIFVVNSESLQYTAESTAWKIIVKINNNNLFVSINHIFFITKYKLLQFKLEFSENILILHARLV